MINTIKIQETDPVLIDVPMPILTPRLLIRPPRAGDGKALNEAKLETREMLEPWMIWSRDSADYTDEKAEIFLRKESANFILRENLMMIVEERSTGKVVASTGFHNLEWKYRSFEIGYWVRKSAQGQGYAQEITNALVRFAFGALDALKVEIGHADGNVASQRVIEKTGFIKSREDPFSHHMADGTLVSSHDYFRLDDKNLPALEVSWGDVE